MAGHRNARGLPLKGDARKDRRRLYLSHRLKNAVNGAARIAAAYDYFRGCAATVHPAVVDAAADRLVPQIVDAADELIDLRKDVPA